MVDNEERILKALEALQADVTAIKTEHGKDIKELKKDVKIIDRKVENVDLKVALIHDQNKKDHAEIMDMLVESNEINYKVLKEELKKLEVRITHLEKQMHSTKN